MKKYIIDTDIGDDIDDAFALDLALGTNLDLVGVTTVFRDTNVRARIAKKLISIYGKEIPVYAGLGITRDGEDGRHIPVCQWTEDLGSPCYAPDNARPEETVEFLVESARKYKEELVFIAIGPLTNLAAAIERDRAAMLGTGGIVMMGGDFVNQYAEWNIRCDVSAAETVFSSGMKIVAFGHNVTSKTRVTPALQKYIFGMCGDERQSYLAELSRLWYATKPEGWLIVLHDVLVIHCLHHPGTCRMTSSRIAVETAGKYTRGMTVNLGTMDDFPHAGNRVEYATGLELKEFLDCFMNKIGYRAEGGNEYVEEKDNGGQFMPDGNAMSGFGGML